MIPITHYVDVSVVLAGAASEKFNFGSLIGVFDHDVTGRYLGPFASVAELVAGGFTSSAEPEVNAWGSSVFSQEPGVDSVFVGKIDGADTDMTDTLDTIEAAAGEDAFYMVNIEPRVEADILLAAAWTEARTKIYIAQNNDTLVAQVTDVTFTGTTSAGTYSIIATHGDDVITVSFTAGGATTAAAVATALIAAWDADEDAAAIADASTGGSGVVTLTFIEPGVVWVITTVVVNGTGVPANSTAAAGTLGSQLQLAGLKRTALFYHAFETSDDGAIPADGYLDGAVSSRCGGFNLDGPNGRGTWAFKNLNGITADDFSAAEANAFFKRQTNLYSRIKGLSFTSKGTMAGGSESNPRFIDVTTSLDWLKIRMEEAILALFVGNPTVIPYTNAGINLVKTGGFSVFDRGVSFGHLSPDFKRVVAAPRVQDVATEDSIVRQLQMTGEATLAGGIHKVIFNITVQQ